MLRWVLSVLGLTLELNLYRDAACEVEDEDVSEAVDGPVSVAGTLVDSGPTDTLLGFQSPGVEAVGWE